MPAAMRNSRIDASRDKLGGDIADMRVGRNSVRRDAAG